MRDMRPPVELVRLAERYARYLGEPTAMPYMAWGRLGQILGALHPTQAFDLACHVIRELPASYLKSFGSGTLAHLIHHHGATLIDWMERQAWCDVDFLEALSNAWIAREDLTPEMVVRLRIATGTRIRIVARSERDARYRAMFEHFVTTRPRQSARHARRPTRFRPSSIESIAERIERSHPELASLLATEAAKPALRREKSSWWLRRAVLFTRLQVSLLSMPPVMLYLVRGALLVWLPWFLATGIATRLLLPTLIVVLCITSTSPVADLALVVGASVLATVGAALAGLASGVINQRRGRLTGAPLYLAVLGLVPCLTIFALITRTEDGLIVAAAVLLGLVALSFIVGFFRRARRRLRRLDRQATARA